MKIINKNNSFGTIGYANIALIKYWGKRDENLFLPTKSSLSVTLDNLYTTTNISKTNNNDLVNLKNSEKIINFLNLFRKNFGIKDFFEIKTENSFPTAAGLASSASGFATLAYGLNKLYNLNLSLKELSILARQGSGSACRSIYGGFVIWHKGQDVFGQDSYAEQLYNQDYWPEFRVLVVLVNEQEKKISSRMAMQNSVNTSLIYDKWVENSNNRLKKLIKALEQKDFDTLGALAQQDCIEMHETIRTSNPPIDFWQKETLLLINKIKELNKSGISCYFTIDAGPNVKVLCLEKDQNLILNNLKNLSFIKNIIKCKIGLGPQIKNYR